MSPMSRPFTNHPARRPIDIPRIGGRRVPAGLRHLFATEMWFDYTEPRCNTCTSPDRWFIERLAARGYPYNWIAKRVPPDGRGRKVDRRSISNHHRKHMSAKSGLDVV